MEDEKMKSVKIGLLIGATIAVLNMGKDLNLNINKIYNDVNNTTGQVVHEMVQPENMVNAANKINNMINSNSSDCGLQINYLDSFQ